MITKLFDYLAIGLGLVYMTLGIINSDKIYIIMGMAFLLLNLITEIKNRLTKIIQIMEFLGAEKVKLIVKEHISNGNRNTTKQPETNLKVKVTDSETKH